MSELRATFAPELVAAIEQLVDERVQLALEDRGNGRPRRFVTVSEAAAATGLSERGVRAQVKRGWLRAKRLGNRILVDLESLEDAG
ncbi:MAG TPA: helix-turn-helix domain-containing protein [Gaiellaceae bacterium]|nr:helix-turn-helix domain-containing protein [Gaiellaceae bacterium]